MGFRRKRIRLPVEEYRGTRAYFVTICTAERRALFYEGELAGWILKQLHEFSGRERFAIHAYCLMPDHLHILTQGQTVSSFLPKFVKGFKQATAFHARAQGVGNLWQRYFYEHILRSEDQMDSIAWYIWMNPVRKGLVHDPKHYTFSGSLTMEWKRTNPPDESWQPPWQAAQRVL